MAGPSTLTPMFRQYHALKRHHPDAILLFRMGDFYEMFHDDAKVASRLLELTLTARGKGTDNVVPMCGFPYHQLDAYTARLVRADQRVAICDQVEDPKQAKGLVKREVVRVVTPGTLTDPAQLEAKENLWIGAVASASRHLGAAFLDLSTGELVAWQSSGDAGSSLDELADRLKGFAPREIVYPRGFDGSEAFRPERTGGAVLSEAEEFLFSASAAATLLEQVLDVASLDGFGLRDRPAAVAAAGGLLGHLRDTQKCALDHIVELRVHEPASHLLLDPATRRNLEIERSLRDGGRRGSLLAAIDRTVTPAGGRLLKSDLLSPLVDRAAILERLDAVEELLAKGAVRERAREGLAGVHDIERLLARAVSGSAGPRDLAGLRASLARLPDWLLQLADLQAALPRRLLDGLDPCDDVRQRLADGLVDDPPATLGDGGVIRDGFNAELDELRTILRDGKAYIASLEQREREATGIGSLKVRYNKVFGYFIEVSKANLHLTPEHYQRKQTIANGERYVTPELKEYESKVLHAQERIESLEQELFAGLRSSVAGQARRLKAVAQVTARMDVLAGLAETAAVEAYSRPEIHEDGRLSIVGGRHLVVEQNLVENRFVPNDTELAAGGRAIGVLTGPNMGGKSTYLRQVALIGLLAQSGSFVPAERAEIGLIDRIFCRVGASDHLAEGQSTFMVEMTETANILHHATAQSLILLDEIGRGTATFDGLSLAWAVVEHLDALPGGAPRTLFATHYHELTELAVELQSVINLRIAVREWEDGVVFTHRVESGASDRSYGIQVARMAGVPRPVVERAREILGNLENDEYGRDGQPRRARRGDGATPARQRHQPTLFDPPVEAGPSRLERDVLEQLRAQLPEELTPLDALNLLAGWKRRLDDEHHG